MREKIKEYFSDNRRTAITVLAVIAVIVLIVGLCLSWFVEQKRLATVGKITAPAELRITGPNETSMSEIDLAYNPDEFEGKDKVTLKRAFSVVSGPSNFKLQLARTTNISDLHIELYRAEDAGSDAADLAGYDNTGHEYSWKKSGGNLYNTADGSSFLNPADGATVDKDGVPNLAEDLNNQIFKSGDNPQQNAISLYWQSEQTPAQTESTKYTVKSGEEKCRVTNYIIELTWTDKTKETDVLYLIARS